MLHKPPSRRDIVQAGAAIGLAAALPVPARAAPPAPTRITPELIEAAKQEGKVVWYNAMDIAVAEKLIKVFEAKFPGIAVRNERSGSERIFQRLAQERAAKIHACDIVNSADAAHFIVWKRDGWLEPMVPEDVAKHFPAEHKDPDGCFATLRTFLGAIAYNTKLVRPEEAPRGYMDLLDPKWSGKIVKSHPAYSGTTMNITFQLVREFGWQYFEKLAAQKCMQVQSSTDPPKKVALGERAVMADGADYLVNLLKAKGDPIELVYPVEGAPTISGPNGMLKNAPNPNAARLLQCWLFSQEGQQAWVEISGQYSAHPLVKPKAGTKLLASIKKLREDPAGVERMAEEIKAKYTQYFKV
jgi:iron(III) transport system substrate-binding protein